MLKSINVKDELSKVRNREIGEKNILPWVYGIFEELDLERRKIREELNSSSDDAYRNGFNFNKIDSKAIFHINQIKKICVNYRLRFLDTHLFKGDYPEEALIEIRRLEKLHNIQLKGFRIIAPSRLFKLKETDDPLLFVPLGNDYYYLIYQWGNDLHPLRKLKFWPAKNVENLAISVFLASFICTLITHTLFFGEGTNFVYALVLFLFYLKGFIGWVLFFGISSGKNFSEYCWESPFNKIS
ncbi:hypothetical protein [Tenacibaculum xiamenense]|uniref:hypothetical protein n=1 Tax=Tenacibaculum xiamenense TaxID=1261553 RepID=UPI003894056A